MKSDFNCFYKRFMFSEAKSEKVKIAQELEAIRSRYGEAEYSEISRLLSVVAKYAKDLKKKKDNKELVPPKPVKKPVKGDYKSEAAFIRAELNYPAKLKKYKEDYLTFTTALKAFNDEKLNEMKTVVDMASTYEIPKDCKLEYVLGNSKVGDDTIIINMGPATTCDAAKAGECELYSMGWCYAQNNESQHKLAIIKRFREQIQWRADTDGSAIAGMIVAAVKQKRQGKRGKPIKYIRFNESGDMRSEADKVKLGNIVKITNELLTQSKQEPIIFYTYTHRSDLFTNKVNDIDYGTDKNALVIQGSGYYKNNKVNTKKPFYVDNCFMGIDYPNLVDLVRTGNFDQITKAEDDDNPGRLDIEFDVGEKPRVVICRGACMSCEFCKTKNANFLILVSYHGTGTKIKVASGQMTTKFKKFDKLLDKTDLTDDIKRELYDIGHFNEYLIVDRLIRYAGHRDSGGKKQTPMLSWDYIVPLMLDIRSLAKQDEEEALQNWKASGKTTGFKPKIYGAGTRFPTVKDLSDYVEQAKMADDKYLAGVASGKRIPKIVKSDDGSDDMFETNSFNETFENIMLTEVKKPSAELPPLRELSLQDIQNLALANKLVTHGDYISPETIQELLNDNGYDTNVMGDDIDTLGGDEEQQEDEFDQEIDQDDELPGDTSGESIQ